MFSDDTKNRTRFPSAFDETSIVLLEAGTGGGLRYIVEESSNEMVNQESLYSCQVACARQLLIDSGFPIPETDLLVRIGYYEGWGTTAEHTAIALSALHPRLVFIGGSIPQESLSLLFSRDPWIANVRTDHGSVHAIIVDRMEDDIVHVRDPWGLTGPGSGTGTRATIELGNFLEHWHWAFNKAVVPIREK